MGDPAVLQGMNGMLRLRRLPFRKFVSSRADRFPSPPIVLEETLSPGASRRGVMIGTGCIHEKRFHAPRDLSRARSCEVSGV